MRLRRSAGRWGFGQDIDFQMWRRRSTGRLHGARGIGYRAAVRRGLIQMKLRKVFGIGFHKTGTTSLAEAMRMLGYRVTGPDWIHTSDIAGTVQRRALRRARKFDAVQDNPWPLLFRELDEAFPDSLFVLTVRETDEWLRSLLQHAGSESTPMRRWIYGVGSPVGHEDLYR